MPDITQAQPSALPTPTMPLLEKLSREVARVSGLRAQYRSVDERNYYPSLRPAIGVMSEAIEAAHKAAGNGDPAAIIGATVTLQEFED